MKAYAAGERDFRPWGHYEVRHFTSENNIEFCEKIITINPGQVLSLQSHELRDEFWQVEDGALTAIRNHNRYHLQTGQTISIPRRTIHSMANLSAKPLIVYERQSGICREDDITRYCDNYGRAIVSDGPNDLFFSISLYNTLLGDIAGLANFLE